MFLPCSFALQDQKDDSHMQVCFLEHSNNNYPPLGQKYPQGLLTQTAIASAVRNKIDRNAFLHEILTVDVDVFLKCIPHYLKKSYFLFFYHFL